MAKLGTTEASKTTTIALLGVTGNTGQVVLRHLLTKDKLNLKVYARSHAKVTRMFPSISQYPTVSLFTGSITDERLIADLLENVSIIICTIGSDGLSPARMQRDAASSIFSVLNKSRSSAGLWKAPRLIWLSSSSTNERFAAARPAIVNWLIQHAFWYGYDDLWAAQRIIQADRDLVSVILIQPGVLVDEAATGYEVSVESVKLAASYEDLGAAITQVALDRSLDSLHQIGVSSKKGDRVLRYAPYIFTRLIRGFLTNYVPLGIWLDAKLAGVIPWYAI